ncbi:MAG: AIR synthase-related protein [Candidatus Woesearchaeota archaeon]
MTSKYAEAGVDFAQEHSVVDVIVKVGNETKENIADLYNSGISFPEEGNDFSGGISLDLEKMVNSGIKKTVLSGGVDGPGSKPVVHALYNGDDEIKLACTAIDSIAMCVNDLICSGARPVLIYEYHSWNDANLDVAKQMAGGKYIAAKLSKAAIVGGENASLSAMITGPIPKKAYDMCNMALGIITDEALVKNPLGKGRVQSGDSVIGVSSSGIHCNGITMSWKAAIDFKNKGYIDSYKINQRLAELGEESVAEAVLTPTIIYVDAILSVLEQYGSHIKAIANITGEGIDNMKRILPENTGMILDYAQSYVQQPHPIFNWIQKNAVVSTQEMYHDYNQGTGMVLVVDKQHRNEIIHSLNQIGKNQIFQSNFKAYELGEIVPDVDSKIKGYAFDNTNLEF